jgi:HTH-type transcriptional regulator/antitoxin HipB
LLERVSIFPNGKMEIRIQTPIELGEAVRDRRKSLRLTQEELAAVASVTPRLLGEIERGKRTAQLDGVLRVLAALGLDLYARTR